MLLALAALAEGREVVVSRGELIEIGDGFRIPDVLARSGARLVEVGTTNRTRAADYERAIGPETARAAARAPVELPRRRLHRAARARRAGRRSRSEPGSRSSTTSARVRSLALGDEPTPAESLRAGADLVCFSGDKLLGGPQAGIVVGRADLVERLRRHPLQRALRADKLTLAALEGTLALALDPAHARRRARPADAARADRERSARAPSGSPQLVGGEVEETVARVGGGALPLAELPSAACAVEESLAEPLRLGEPPVVALVRDGRTLLDCRTLTRRGGRRGRRRGRHVRARRAAPMPLTVGTAGHIDHGKTWLVRALTGKDTDRLPEEQRRGISIDLGYAPLELPDGRQLSVVDVPGHERFVRTMVAGATGIDLFLLVIDAGEGARPQTHEHLAILRLLGDRARRRRAHEGRRGRRRDARAGARRRRASSCRTPRSSA